MKASQRSWIATCKERVQSVVAHKKVNTILTSCLFILALYVSLVSLLKLDFFSPLPAASAPASESANTVVDPTRSIVSLFILAILALAAGRLVNYIHVPSLIGMILIGAIVGNVDYTSERVVVAERFKEVVAQLALATILIRAGLALDLAFLAKQPSLPVALGVGTTLLESVAVALAAHFLLGIEVKLSLIFGAASAELAPAVVITGALRLRARGLGVPNIVNLMMASAVLGNVLCIILMAVASSLALSESGASSNASSDVSSGASSNASSDASSELEIVVGTVLRSVCQLIVGSVLGPLAGALLWVIPAEGSAARFRPALFASIAAAFVLGANSLGHGLAGSVAAVLCSIVASQGWRQRKHEEKFFAKLWTFILEPLLFVLIGRDFRLENVTSQAVLYSFALIGVGFLTRCSTVFAGTFLSAKGSLCLRERVFLGNALYSKTMQAILVPIFVAACQARGVWESESKLLFVFSVLSIVVTATTGALWIDITGPRLLLTKAPSSEQQSTSTSEAPVLQDDI